MRYLLAALIALALLPSTAQAHGPTLAQTIAIADATVPTCQGVAPRFTAGLANTGLAHGWIGQTWTATCDIELRAGMDGSAVCAAYRHERLHFLYGPEHTHALLRHASPPPGVEDPCYPPVRVTTSAKRSRRSARHNKPSRRAVHRDRRAVRDVVVGH